MNTINRIKKITEAHDHIDQAINLVLGAIPGLPIEKRVKKEIISLLTQLVDGSIYDSMDFKTIMKEVLK
jgi:hypothetical protein